MNPLEPKKIKMYVPGHDGGKYYTETRIHHRDDGVIEYYNTHNELHRVDGPAMIHPDGTKEWFLFGVQHRTDGPAKIRVDGQEIWYYNGVVHRDDGPALKNPDGREEYFYEGTEISEVDYNRSMENRKKIVIFLDIDGVLVSYLNMKGRYIDGDYYFIEEAVRALNHITDTLGAKIVLSSTWRLSRALIRMVDIFKLRGVKGELISYTPSNTGGKRGSEIKTWLSENQVDEYFIIDDETQNILEEFPSSYPHILTTNRYRGLDYYDAIYICGGETYDREGRKYRIHPVIGR